MSIKSLYSNEEEEWKNTEESDITRLHDANPTHLSTKNNEGQLPIHCAIAAADISVIKKMHELNGLLKKNMLVRLVCLIVVTLSWMRKISLVLLVRTFPS
mgnify:CR=1 FL=1